mgnify:CR=1 FL=1
MSAVSAVLKRISGLSGSLLGVDIYNNFILKAASHLINLPLSFHKETSINTDNDIVFKNILKNNKKIEKIIIKYAPRYPIEKISKIDLAILKLSVYELIFEKKNPPKVIIDEAVELAKEFGNDRSYSFINGVLGSVLKDLDIKNDK